jgi:hypothetical protein
VVEPIRPVGRRGRDELPPIAPVRRVHRDEPRDEAEERERERRREAPGPPDDEQGDGAAGGHVDVLA